MTKLTRTQKKELKKQNSLLEVKDTCVNCAEYIALDQRFCSFCGGKRIYNRLTWRNLIEDFADRFLNLENSFLKTFIAMFKRPEEVIGGYMNGMRKKYLPAFSYFAIAITVAGFFGFVLKNYFMEEVVTSSVNSPIGINEMAGVPVAEMQEVSNSMTTSIREYLSWVSDHQTLIYIAIIPFLAIISRIVFWNYKKYNFVEHLVIYLYAYSHIAMITTLTNLLFLWNSAAYQISSFITFPVMILYIGWVLKRLFVLNTASIILKTTFFGFIIGGVLVVSIIVLFAINARALVNGEEVDGFFGKAMKIGWDKAQREKEALRDSLRQDSLKRLENTLEITPEMIKNRPQ